MDNHSLFVDEVFLSLQGEGLEVGRPHLFLRLGGCPLRCKYCDTPRSWKAQPQFEFHLPAGTELRCNPLSPAQLNRGLEEILRAYHLSVADVMLAVTGGEPLVQGNFLQSWLPTWDGSVLLETAGVAASELAKLLPAVELLSLDWKLPHTLHTGSALLEPEECLKAAQERKVLTQVKLVLTEATSDQQVATALLQIVRHMPTAKVFLQPVTPFGNGPAAPSAEQLLRWSLYGREFSLELRVLPQIHPLLGVR